MTVVVTHTTPADSSFSTEGAAAWNADHALSGVGTMAEQNANNVDITGGGIDNTVIGNVTPNAATFTTLTATGQTSLGGAADANNFRVYAPSGVTRYLAATGTASGDAVLFSAGPAGSTPAVAIYARSTGVIKLGTRITNGDTTPTGTVQFQVSDTASAVNYVQVTGAATGNNVTISAQGSDASVFGTLLAKGNGGWDITGNGASTFRNSAGANQFRVTPTSSAVNLIQATGAVAGAAPSFSSIGSDTNISMALQSKGTGAIDLAAGSSGVNISNGTTVTAITRTATNSNYTSAPTVAISAPTTAGGVQATATCSIGMTLFPINGGGTGYTVGDVLTMVGGTFTTAARVTVSAVSGGVITAVTGTDPGVYTVAPTNPVSVTGGTGTGATFNCSFAVNTAFTITNAGSGYVEQPTVTFSGGGGSGAAAYATVGSGTVVRSLGSTGTQSIDFYTPASNTNAVPAFRMRDVTTDSYLMTAGASLTAQGNSASSFGIWANGSGTVNIGTGGTSNTRQMAVAHTASAVNYVQVTGAATGLGPVISAQGSDTNVRLRFASKNAEGIQFEAGGVRQFYVGPLTNAVNFIQAVGATAGSAPTFSVLGSDTNIGLNLTTKGTGAISLNTGGGTQFQVQDLSSATTAITARGGVNGGNAQFGLTGTGNTDFIQYTLGTGAFRFLTNGVGQDQMRITHTASAVNYVQVTGAATGGTPTISAQGSDSGLALSLAPKGTGQSGSGAGVILLGSDTLTQFRTAAVSAASGNTFLEVQRSNGFVNLKAVTGAANGDITLTPQGTGNVRFGTYTANMALTVQGYIEIKDSGGTVRKLAVIA